MLPAPIPPGVPAPWITHPDPIPSDVAPGPLIHHCIHCFCSLQVYSCSIPGALWTSWEGIPVHDHEGSYSFASSPRI